MAEPPDPRVEANRWRVPLESPDGHARSECRVPYFATRDRIYGKGAEDNDVHVPGLRTSELISSHRRRALSALCFFRPGGYTNGHRGQSGPMLRAAIHLLAPIIFLPVFLLAQPPSTLVGMAFFETNIRPLLAANCY